MRLALGPAGGDGVDDALGVLLGDRGDLEVVHCADLCHAEIACIGQSRLRLSDALRVL